MRIISGLARGTKFNTIESKTTRPTLDRVRESLFNIIQNDIRGASVLDLFAGSGALGLEALSRYAKTATFCDNNKSAVNIINQNLIKTHLEDKAEVLCMDYLKCIEKLSQKKMKFDIVFVDPPYKLDIAVKACELIIKNKLVKDNGLIIIETDEPTRDEKEINQLIKENNTMDKIELKSIRKYGRANLLFIRVNGEN